jgi:hypothetical protein
MCPWAVRFFSSADENAEWFSSSRRRNAESGKVKRSEEKAFHDDDQVMRDLRALGSLPLHGALSGIHILLEFGLSEKKAKFLAFWQSCISHVARFSRLPAVVSAGWRLLRWQGVSIVQVPLD